MKYIDKYKSMGILSENAQELKKYINYRGKQYG